MSRKHEKLKAKLQKLFQLDKPELDFGLYRNIHSKAAEVSQFLDRDLLPQVKEALSGSVRRRAQRRLTRVAAPGAHALALGFAGCGAPPEPPPPWSPEVQVWDSAGAEIVESGHTGAWGPHPRGVEELVRIGVVEGEEPYQLFNVADVAVDRRGRVYVANRMTASVRVFDGQGRFLHEFGGRGEGPGEFTDLFRLFLTADELWVADQSQLRATGFTYDGRVLDTWTYIRDGVLSPLHRAPQGWLGLVFRADEPRPVRPPPGTSHITRRFLQQVDPGIDAATAAPSGPVVELPPRVLYATHHGARWDWPLFQPRYGVGVDEAGRIFLAPGDPYQVEMFSPDGELLRRVRRPWTPRPLGPEVVAELLGHVRSYFLDGGFSGPRSAALRQLDEYTERMEWQASLPTGAHLPPTGRLLVSPDGSFWLERTDDIPPALLEFERTFGGGQSGIESRRAGTWDLFDTDGHFLGQVQLPRGFTPHRGYGLEVLGVEKDEMGVEYVVWYAVAEG